LHVESHPRLSRCLSFGTPLAEKYQNLQHLTSDKPLYRGTMQPRQLRQLNTFSMFFIVLVRLNVTSGKNDIRLMEQQR